MSDASAALHRELRAAMQRWRLVQDGPVVDTLHGCVAFVTQGSQRCALKITRADSDETNAVAALTHYDGRGAVRLLDHAGRAVLMERIEPGHRLTARVIAGEDDGATAILSDVMTKLHRDEPPAGQFPPVEDWGESFDDHQQTGGALPPSLVDRAAALYRELCSTQGARVLLHGDLHHDNVLYDAQRGWVAIDPKGVIGERAYETGALLRNPGTNAALFATPTIIDRRVRILCERLALDRARVLGWCFAQAVLSAIWASEDGCVDERGRVTAEATLPLL